MVPDIAAHAYQQRIIIFLSGLFMALLPAAVTVAQPSTGEYRKVAPEEAAKFAYDWAQQGVNPDAGTLMDTTIAVITVAYPPAGAVLGIAKGLVMAMSSGPDPVGEAISRINQQLNVLNTRVDHLQKQVNALRDETFRNANNARLRELLNRKQALENLRDDLLARPTDAQAKSKIAREAMRIADRFIPANEADADLWQWSDRLRVYTDPDNPARLKGELLPPQFKPIPTFEYYMSALGLWMAAIENEGLDAATVKTKYGPALLRHASFLSVRPYWREMDEPPSAANLPERVMAGVTCGIAPVSKYPQNGICNVREYCTDTFAQTNDVTIGSRTFTAPPGGPNVLCTLPVHSVRGVSETERERARTPERLVYGSEALALMEDRTQRDVPPEGDIERNWGVDAMTLLADQLVRLARHGTLREQYVGRFDMTFWKKQVLYAVKPDGELLWYTHLIGIDRNPPRAGGAISDRVRDGALDGVRIRPSARPSAAESATRNREAQGVARRLRDRAHAQAPAASIHPQRQQREPAPPRIIHQWEGPKLVGSGWQGYRDILPAGFGATGSQSYGFSLYGVTPEGVLKWYRHDGVNSGDVQWKGPIDSGSGWNVFQRIVAMGDGVLYGLGSDGSLTWYRHSNVMEAAAQPVWSGPKIVGSGWHQFTHVFGGGQGVLYAVKPDGTLLWYRHTGYQNGEPSWQGPQQVGTGWQGFKQVFSPGDGMIYALQPNGDLMWYQHDGYLDGSARWQESTKIAAQWHTFRSVFPLMWGTPVSPVVR